MKLTDSQEAVYAVVSSGTYRSHEIAAEVGRDPHTVRTTLLRLAAKGLVVRTYPNGREANAPVEWRPT